MIKSVTVINDSGEERKLTLTRPDDSGFIITSITGLGPAKATINTTDLATEDGAIFNSSRVQFRNIVFNLRFLEGTLDIAYVDSNGYDHLRKANIEDVRLMSYKYFPIKRKVKLIFETDNRTVYTDGYVESNEPNIFSPEEDTTISVICPDPYFYIYGSKESFEYYLSDVSNEFEFPFENESISENLLEFGLYQENHEYGISYYGDRRVGVEILIHFTGSVGDISIYNRTTNEEMTISSSVVETITGSAIAALDEIRINTNPGKKSAYLIRNGVYYNILSALGRDSDWISLVSGVNFIGYLATSGDDNIEIILSTEVAYEGI